MENEVHAHRDGVVSELTVSPGEPVRTGQVICVVAPAADAADPAAAPEADAADPAAAPEADAPASG
jgi:pyruvate/2-oxoglutarate dehydrogenase complex dihydrolipoamide acyltransferase (E2) component